MEEAEYLCDEIAIIHKGKIIAFDTPTGLKQKYGRGAKTIELTFKDMLDESFINLLNTTISKKDGNVEDNGVIIVSRILMLMEPIQLRLQLIIPSKSSPRYYNLFTKMVYK